jgi:hypothetical protein
MEQVDDQLVQSAANEIAEYSPIEAGLAELRKKYGNIVVDVSTPKALDEARRVRAEIRDPRYKTEAIRKALKAPALAHAKLIDTEAARITAELLKIETPWDEAIKAEETRREAEKVERERLERQRITAIHARIAEITGFALLGIECRTAERVQGLIDKVNAISLEGFEEFEDEAKAAHGNTLARLEQIHAAKFAEEAERSRVKAEQAAERDRLEAQRREQEAAAAAEAQRLEAQRQAQEAAAATERERLAQQARLQEQAALEAQQRRDEQAAADKIRRDADTADIAERREAFAREQAAARELLDAQARDLAAQQEALEAANPVSPAAQALNEQQGGERFAEHHPTVAAMKSALTEFDEQVAEPTPYQRSMADVQAAVHDAAEKAKAGNTIPADVTDADLIWLTSRFVASEYGVTQEQAITRLSAVVWTV